MRRDGGVDLRAAVALIMAIPIALVIVLTFSPFRIAPVVEAEPEPVGSRSKAKPLAPAKKAGGPNTEQPLSVAPPPRAVLAPREAAVAKNELAQRGCRRISDAIAGYMNSASNPGATARERLPQSPLHLNEPPFGGGSFLPNGNADLIDPWGKAYQFMPTLSRKGDMFYLVFTYNPDGTHISQFGIGQNSYPAE